MASTRTSLKKQSSLKVERNKEGKIKSHVRQIWLVESPEERVRQEYLCVLVNEYGFSLEQIKEEMEVTGPGSGKARADFVIWRTGEDKQKKNNPLIIVECKSDNVTISSKDYAQGDNYARLTGARFFVTHNNRETKYWRVLHKKMPKELQEIENTPHADASDKEIEELIKQLKIFKEDEFANLLHQCHNVIRNREKKDPAAAFDEIAKILFVKVYVERRLKGKKSRKNLFTVEVLEEQIAEDPLDDLFQNTKAAFREDLIFEDDERINLKTATGREIVKLLERYNLSDTSEDIKGIAFERFLGRTFRGEIGQFFTPRTIVEFMVRMVEPKEGDIICDPASGSGGFLIRFFEVARDQILSDVDRKYQRFKKEIEKKKYGPKKKAELLRKEYDRLQESLDNKNEKSRIWKLANKCIFGTDANDRMARTSKMNMIMHGDGHGGIHHHDGFLNVNGIFEERFDIVLTNPPFGANVEPSDVVLESDIKVTPQKLNFYELMYGDSYKEARKRVQAAKGDPISSIFDIPKKPGKSKVKTEILFIERCLELLKPGGRLGIVLPEGIFNNPSLAYVREFCEDRAFIRAVVSLPQETFFSIGASVKASLLFMTKFTEKEKAVFDKKKKQAEDEVKAKYEPKIEEKTGCLVEKLREAKANKEKEKWKALQKELKVYKKEMDKIIAAEARSLLKERFPYPTFLYNATKVGLSATGEPDENELYQNRNIPRDIDKTCLDHYQLFRKNPDKYLLKEYED